MPSQENGPEDKGPWNTTKKLGSPEIDTLLRQGRERLGGMLPDEPPSAKGFLIFGAIALAALGAWTSYYTVPSDSVVDLSRFDAAPLIAFSATKEMNYGTETDR